MQSRAKLRRPTGAQRDPPSQCEASRSIRVTHADGLKEKRDRQQLLLEIAGDLFILRGYGNVTIGEIVSRLGVSRREVYATFGSKRELLEAVIVNKRAWLRAALQEAVVSDLDRPKSLVDAGVALALVMVSKPAVDLLRLVIYERECSPDLGRLVWEEFGCGATLAQRFTVELPESCRAGKSGAELANMFVRMVAGDLVTARLLGLHGAVNKDVLQRRATLALGICRATPKERCE